MVSNEARVLVVDARPLRGAAIAAIVQRLTGSDSYRIASIASPGVAEELIDAGLKFQMIVYSIGSDSVSASRHREGIKKLRRLAAPIVIFSDNATQKEIVLALTLSVQGFLHSGMAVEITQQALSFMLQGGSYLPPLQNSRSRSSRQNGSLDASASDTVPQHALAKASSNDGLTQRQRLVLQCLKRGDSNKSTARTLGIRESTVKVYIRQLMQKFGVNNRTRLAMTLSMVPETEPLERDSES
jgi:DNA-binding NarL/FixJ family response regulator